MKNKRFDFRAFLKEWGAFTLIVSVILLTLVHTIKVSLGLFRELALKICAASLLKIWSAWIFLATLSEDWLLVSLTKR